MGMGHRTKKRKRNNAGSAIVTVLVVVTFITILATVLLYISGMNFQMKVTDYRTKESFYQAEVLAEELRAQLVKDVEFAFAEAYTAAVSEYSGLSDAGGREANYRQHFCEELMRIWEKRCGLQPGSSTEWNWNQGITSILLSDIVVPGVIEWNTNSTTKISELSVPAAPGEASGEYWKINLSGVTLDTTNGITNGQIILKGITFTYDSPTHYSSIVSTDYCITIPNVNWSETYESAGAPVPTAPPGESPAPMVTPKPLYFDGNYSGCVNYMNWTKQ